MTIFKINVFCSWCENRRFLYFMQLSLSSKILHLTLNIKIRRYGSVKSVFQREFGAVLRPRNNNNHRVRARARRSPQSWDDNRQRQQWWWQLFKTERNHRISRERINGQTRHKAIEKNSQRYHHTSERRTILFFISFLFH